MRHNHFHATAKTLVYVVGLIVCAGGLRANDGAYRSHGNQLIPLADSIIAVKSEVLKIYRMDAGRVEVDVLYQFDNPGSERDVLVGFEADAPSGDTDGRPKKGQHPGISDFQVVLNNKALTWNVAFVENGQPIRVKQTRVESLNLKKRPDTSSWEVDYRYVYYFNAHFLHGTNTLHHHYICKLSTSVDEAFSYTYILSAASRWAGGEIGDFELELRMGDFESFDVQRSFFSYGSEWDHHGIVKTVDNSSTQIDENAKWTRFHVRSGSVVFKAKHFKAQSELYIRAKRMMPTREAYVELPMSLHRVREIEEAELAIDKKVLYNLPFARRGFVFKNPVLRKWYDSQEWYMPDPTYKPDPKALSKEEQAWMKKFAKTEG